MPDPDAVYAHPDGRDYVALFGEGEGKAEPGAGAVIGWFRWPATAAGWAEAKACAATLADECRAYDSRQSWLALRLSGVPR